MSARTNVRVPKYSLHKPTGLAVVRLSGRDLYLGPHGTAESESRYESIVAEWRKHDRRLPPKPERVAERENLVVNELILAYLEFAKSYYVKGGETTGEMNNVRDALRVVTRHFGSTRVKDFGPVELRRVRDAMVASDLCRGVVNARINRVRRMFKWGVEHGRVDPVGGLIPPDRKLNAPVSQGMDRFCFVHKYLLKKGSSLLCRAAGLMCLTRGVARAAPSGRPSLSDSMPAEQHDNSDRSPR